MSTRIHCCKILVYDPKRNKAVVCSHSAKWRIHGEGGEEDYVDACDTHLADLAREQADPKAVIERHENYEEEA